MVKYKLLGGRNKILRRKKRLLSGMNHFLEVVWLFLLGLCNNAIFFSGHLLSLYSLFCYVYLDIEYVLEYVDGIIPVSTSDTVRGVLGIFLFFFVMALCLLFCCCLICSFAGCVLSLDWIQALSIQNRQHRAGILSTDPTIMATLTTLVDSGDDVEV